MPTKDELEIEVATMRLQVDGRPAKKGCNDSCSHGLLYHGGPICYGEGRINTFQACVCPAHSDPVTSGWHRCPEHPDDPLVPIPAAKWVE